MISGHLNVRTESASQLLVKSQKAASLGYPNGDAASFDVYAFINFSLTSLRKKRQQKPNLLRIWLPLYTLQAGKLPRRR